MIDFVMNHQAMMAALVVAIADFVFAVSPSLAGNGIVHQIYVVLKGKAGSQ